VETENIEYKLKENLQRFSIEGYDQVKPSVKEQLLNIEKYLIDCEEKISSTVEILNSINLTVRGIANESGVSKSTIYNSPDFLKKYIEERVNEISKKDLFSKEKVQHLQNQVGELQNLLDKMTIDIIKFENLSISKEKLEKEVARLTNKAELNNEERNQFISQINAMEVELRKYRNQGKVISFGTNV
jgi:uncharacterized ubiquitin-like protein YukD